jgi:hypothetical protein
MSERVLLLRAVGVCGLLLLALAAAGCGRRPTKQAELQRMAELERMADSLQTNAPHTPPGEEQPRTRGLYVDERFWVDKERSRETTVRRMLVELGASLQDGKVVDETGTELYFYGVREGPFAGPDRDRHQQNTEGDIRELEKRYRVIRMYGPAPKE